MHRLGFVRVRHLRVCAVGLAAVLAVACVQGAQAGELTTSSAKTFSGDWGGARSRLSESGIDLSLRYTGEVFGNLEGGLERSATYEDLIRFEVDTDLETLAGWAGATAHVSVLQIDDGGRNIEDLVGAFSDPSTIDAVPATRLFTAWVQQRLGELGNVRLGQLAADDEFLISNTASALLNSTFAWADLVDINLPGGGPAYPLATPGARLKLEPAADLAILAAVFSGDPAGSCGDDEDPQICNKHGTTFSFTGGALFMGEIQYRPRPSRADTPRTTYKLGGFYHTADFPDEARGNGNNGQVVSLAIDAADPLEHQGNWGLYGVVDHVVWQNGASRLAVFWRGGVVPPDRNLISWYTDGGLAVSGPLRGRPDDTLAFGVAYANVSNEAISVDEVRRRLDGSPYPIRDGETVFELTYRAQLAPWWTLQPDVQYIVHPGGDVPDPDDPSAVIGDSVLVGLRTRLAF